MEKAIHAKLGRSRSTGLMPPVRLFVLYTILRHIFSIAVGYGGKLTNDNKTMSVTIETFENASKVLAPAKFSGTNFLKKRHFEKIRENGRSIFKYSWRAAVVVACWQIYQQQHSAFKGTTKMISHWICASLSKYNM